MLWISGALAAALLTLGVNGTLSAWSSAVINNNTNSVATANGLILKETNGTSTCYSSDGAQTTVNSATCTTINKYGGVSVPLQPGTSQTVTVTFTNVGAANGSNFTLTPGTCAYTPTTGTPTPTNLCTTSTNGLTVAVACNTGSTFGSGTAWTSPFVISAVAPGNMAASYIHPATSGDLNAASSWTCQFTVALNSLAPITAQGETVTQSLQWTLS